MTKSAQKCCHRKAFFLILTIVLLGMILPPVITEMTMDIKALSATCHSGNDDKAIDACTKIINSYSAKEEDIIKALAYRTESFYQTSQLEKALLGTEDLIKRSPQMAEAYFLRAKIFELQNKIKEAAETYAQVAEKIADKKEKADSLAFSGILYHAAGEKELGLEKINLALQVDPESVQAFDMKHHIDLKEGRLDTALEALNEKLSAHPFDTGWLCARSITKMLQHNDDGAMKDINDAISLNQRDPYYVLWLHLIRSKT